jgi:arylsulfatase A
MTTNSPRLAHLPRRSFLSAAAAGTFLGSLCPTSAQAQGRKPNLVFVLADDLGIANLGCYGSDHFKTPNIDRLAQSGIRFTNGYTAPLCGPSRALILTGRYAFRTGATNQDATGEMKPTVETFTPRLLKPAGYVSACVGKWGQLPLGPSEFGFDEHLTINGSGTYWNTQARGKDYRLNGERKDLRDKEYLPDLMHNYVDGFLTRHRARPFYLYYSLSHIHGDILPTPDSKPDSRDHYADNIAYMDKLIGKLTASLDRLKLRHNTLVIFVGDNGTAQNFADRCTIGGRRLSGEKGSLLEGGALVPLIASWPGHTPAGHVSPQLIDSTDFQPTFADLAGAPLPPNTPADGHSFAPQLQGRKGPARDWVYIQLARQWYVRDATHKLNQKGELFDMAKAPFEEPLTENPAARRKLQAALDQLNPAAGILDHGDGTGRHAKREQNRKKQLDPK